MFLGIFVFFVLDLLKFNVARSLIALFCFEFEMFWCGTFHPFRLILHKTQTCCFCKISLSDLLGDIFVLYKELSLLSSIFLVNSIETRANVRALYCTILSLVHTYCANANAGEVRRASPLSKMVDENESVWFFLSCVCVSPAHTCEMLTQENKKFSILAFAFASYVRTRL